MVSDLLKGDLLHTMQIGMLDHLQKWNFDFMKWHIWLDRYNAIWLSVPAYHDLTATSRSYEEVSPWNGKEMKVMSRVLLGVVTKPLRGGSPTQYPIFNHPIGCTQALWECYMYGRYKSHDDATLSYFEDALCLFHTFKDIFVLRLASKWVQAKANPLRTQHLKKWKVDMETNAETWTPSKKWCKMNSWQDHISHEIQVSKELDADFNLPWSTWYLIRSNRFVDTEPSNSFLPREMNKHIKWTSRMAGTPPITISTTCHK